MGRDETCFLSFRENMSKKWTTAFKEIHGKTPTKMDYELAPKHIREELIGSSEQENTEPIQEKLPRKSGIRLKRPADDELSPFKPLPKRHAADIVTTPTRSSKKTSRSLFTKSAVTPTTKQLQPIRSSPRKSPVSFHSDCYLSDIQARVNVSIFDTPEKNSVFSPRKVHFAILPEECPSTSQTTAVEKGIARRTSPRKTPVVCNPTLFSTPEKTRSPAVGADVLKTPIRSPQKPLRASLHMMNADALLAPTPEKQPVEEEEEVAFEAEDVPELETKKKAKKRIAAGGVARVFDPTTGRVRTRPFKQPAAEESSTGKDQTVEKKPKEKGNFVRINLRKKSFTRGKVSAEAKRKLRKKQMWKKRFGGKK